MIQDTFALTSQHSSLHIRIPNMNLFIYKDSEKNVTLITTVCNYTDAE